jgi:hypothetical protein
VIAARLLACLLGPPCAVPMGRLLDMDQQEFNRCVTALARTDVGTDVTATRPGVARCAVHTPQGEEVDA